MKRRKSQPDIWRWFWDIGEISNFTPQKRCMFSWISVLNVLNWTRHIWGFWFHIHSITWIWKSLLWKSRMPTQCQLFWQDSEDLIFRDYWTRWWFQILFMFTPTWEWSNLANIFQMGWNHQLAQLHAGWVVDDSTFFHLQKFHCLPRLGFQIWGSSPQESLQVFNCYLDVFCGKM